MIQLNHLLHPVRSAKSACRLITAMANRRALERQLRAIPRGQREQCWCKGDLLPFRWHPGYGLCAKCGCYVNRYPPSDFQKLYSSELYWHVAQRYYGYLPIESRADLYRRDGRLAYWLRLIERYSPSRGTVSEVGCAPGILMAELQSQGYECFGVEPDEKTADWIRRHMRVNVRAGLFPGVQLPNCDLFLAFDVIEHAPFPDQFMQEVARLLNPGGVAIIQTPVERYGYEPPFGKAFESAFKDFEHLFLFSNKAIEELARLSGLEITSLDERLWLHHEICVFKKPQWSLGR